MNWLILLAAGLCEVAWACGIKYTEGFSRPLPSVLTIAAMAASITLLGLAIRSIPLGTAYAIWTGIGATGAALFGILVLDEGAGPVRLLCIGLIVAGVAGLKLSA